MSQSRLQVYRDAYMDICTGTYGVQVQNSMLSELQRNMEKEFDIPLLVDLNWEEEHSAILALYRSVVELIDT